MLSGSTRHHIIDLEVIELRGSEKLTVSNWGVLSEWWVYHSMRPENQVWYSNLERNMSAQTSVTHATNKMKIFTFNIRCCSQITAPFGDAYEKIGTTQRRLGWPLHKDDTLFQSGRPTGLHIYFSLVFLGLASHSLLTYMFTGDFTASISFGLQKWCCVFSFHAPSERFVDPFWFTLINHKTITCWLHLTHQREGLCTT